MNTLGSEVPAGMITPSSTPSYLTTIWAALFDEYVDELILSIEVR